MEDDAAPRHVSVLVDEVRALLEPQRGGLFVDGTVGLGGHARMLLEGGAERLIGIDRDPRALELARETLAPFGDRVTLVHADYRELPAVLAAEGAPFGRLVAFETRDPECGLVPHDGSPLPAPRRVLVTSLAAGGAAAWAVLERP